MLVSHETPLQLLDLSLSYNDYDYCLVHLLPLYPKYLEFYKKSKSMGRRILLDNSMFELKEAFDADSFAKWVNEILPYEYIVPDVYSDADNTKNNFEKWMKDYKDVPGKKIGVVQGKTYQELVDCYLYMAAHADKIAISFDNQYLMTTGYSLNMNPTRWHILMEGRYHLIRDLIIDGFWKNNIPHHLLGCALPQEFRFYQNIQGIESIDTSSPIIAGMHGIRYNEFGLNDKNTTLLADLIEANITDEMWEDISYNIKMFKTINNIK
ncbi:MAG: hypothetical protein PHS54_00460 [Clostridia bacterium]|nr:hypothetical protein [Clostridia bacterium]